MLNILLWKNTQNGATIWRVVHIFTRKKIIDEDIHLGIGQ